jgi:hypothetical protein
MTKIPLEIKDYEGQKVLFVDGELFDWGIDEEALSLANEQFSNEDAMKAIHTDMRDYFLECLGSVLGFKPTIKQVNLAIKSGFIDAHNK